MMTTSFSLLIDSTVIFNNLLNNVVESFDIIKSNKISKNNFTMVSKKRNFILNITPKKLYFNFGNVQEEDFKDTILVIKKFLTDNFKDKLIGIMWYEGNEHKLFQDIQEVKLLLVQ